MTSGVNAQLRLPAIISDHMVLQQGMDASVWGWAKPGKKVVVKIAGQVQDATVKKDGRWLVRLSELAAAGPHRMTVSCAGESITIKDILVGEVWLNSGQSNMEQSVASSGDSEKEIAVADWPQIRLFQLEMRSSVMPLEDTPGVWKVCSADSVTNFSAVAYFFGRELHKELKLPVGLIQSAWGGTEIECWLSPDSVKGDAYFSKLVRRWEKSKGDDHGTAQEPLVKDGVMEFALEFAELTLVPKAGSQKEPLVLDDFADADRKNRLGGRWSEVNSNSQEGLSFKPGTEQQGVAHFSGRLKQGKWAVVSAGLSADGSAVDFSAYHGLRCKVRGTGQFKIGLHQPSVKDWDSHVTGVIMASADWQEVTVPFEEFSQADGGQPKLFTPDQLSMVFIAPVIPTFVPQEPFGLYHAMIVPLLPYTLRGSTWYQGEANVAQACRYRKLLPALIMGWRRSWANENLAFLVVQLANFRKVEVDPTESDWAELREAQAMVLDVSDTGLAVITDIGDADDIHPKNKHDVGRRLALWALGTTYGRDIVYSGPLYDSMKLAGEKIRLSFKHVGSGLKAKSGNKLRGFALAGEDRKFVWAEAEIEGETVVLNSKKISSPVAVRYNWADNPQGNLYNEEGLPAAPFRTDDWPGITLDTGFKE